MKHSTNPRKASSYAGFTLVELLVVIAIIGILISMLLPAVQQVREAARRTACMNQVRQMALAALNFESAHMHFPVGSEHVGRVNDVDSFGWGWRTKLLPFMEQNNLVENFDTRVSSIDSVNAPFMSEVVPTFICPSDGDMAGLTHPVGGIEMSMSSYLGNGGSIEWAIAPTEPWSDGILMRAKDYDYNGISLGAISDGTSNTFFCGETLSYANILNRTFIWDPAMYASSNNGGTAARTLCQVRTGHGVLNPDPDTDSIAVLRNSYASFHPGGAVFALCDGSTHFIGDNIEHNQLTAAQWEAGEVRGTYQRLFSRKDGLVVGDY